MKIITPPHSRSGIRIEEPELIIDEALEIIQGITEGIFYFPGSFYNDCFAVAQSQVSNDPTRYFVINPKWEKLIKEFGGEVIYNPKILSKDKISKKLSKEGCLSWPFRPEKKVKRYEKIEVEYGIIKNIQNKGIFKGRKIIKVAKRKLEGLPAIIFQHELEHLNGKSIWQKN